MQNSYTPLPVVLSGLLGTPLVAPRNQRPFAWVYENATKFLENAWFMFERNRIYDIGTFIVFYENGIVFVYDGQSRITTSLIILKEAKSYLTESQQLYVDRLLFLDTTLTPLTDQQTWVKETQQWDNYPIFQSYYDDDLLALGDYMNDKRIKHKHIKNCAKACSDFFSEIEDSSKIWEFVRFFLQSTAMEKRFSDRFYAARYMNIVNNTGVPMSEVANARNLILMYVPENKQDEVAQVLDRASDLPDNIKVIRIACLSFSNMVYTKERDLVEEILQEVVKSQQSLNKFLGLLKDITNLISRGLENLSSYKLASKTYVELLWNIVLPVAVINKLNVEDTDKLIQKATIHCVKHGLFSANPMAFRNKWIAKAKEEWLVTKTYTLPTFEPIKFEELKKLIDDGDQKNKNVIIACHNMTNIQHVSKETYTDNVLKTIHEL